MQAVVGSGKREKVAPKKMNLLEFYEVKKRTLALELSPETKSYRGQIKFELSLKMTEVVVGAAAGEANAATETKQVSKLV